MENSESNIENSESNIENSESNIENSEPNKDRLAYVDRVENLAEGFLDELDGSDEESKSHVSELIDLFVHNVDLQKVSSKHDADEEIKKLWQNLREKMMNQEMNDQNVRTTTKRYVREFLEDIQPRTTKKRDLSSKIKLTEEEQQKLKLFGQL